MDPATDLSYAIDWYLESIPSSSTFPPGPPTNAAAVELALDEIARAIAPMQLPGEIAWMWRSWQAGHFSPLPYPGLTGPNFALESWVQNAVESGDPKILFPIAYESHGFLLVELRTPSDVAAPIWSYAYGNQEYVLAYPSLASLFRSCAEAAEVAGVRPPDDDNDRYATYADVLDGPVFDSIVDRHFAASPHTDRDRRVPAGDVRQWPRQWQQAQGVDDESFSPLGATHTVHQFAAEASRGAVVGRIVGRFRVQGGGGLGPGGTAASFGVFSDGSDSIQVLVPDAVLDVGGRSNAVEVEIELEATGPVANEEVPDTRSIQDAALRGDISAATEAAAAWGQSLDDATTRMPIVRRIVPIA